MPNEAELVLTFGVYNFSQQLVQEIEILGSQSLMQLGAEVYCLQQLLYSQSQQWEINAETTIDRNTNQPEYNSERRAQETSPSYIAPMRSSQQPCFPNFAAASSSLSDIEESYFLIRNAFYVGDEVPANVIQNIISWKHQCSRLQRQRGELNVLKIGIQIYQLNEYLSKCRIPYTPLIIPFFFILTKEIDLTTILCQEILMIWTQWIKNFLSSH